MTEIPSTFFYLSNSVCIICIDLTKMYFTIVLILEKSKATLCRYHTRHSMSAPAVQPQKCIYWFDIKYW